MSGNRSAASKSARHMRGGTCYVAATAIPLFRILTWVGRAPVGGGLLRGLWMEAYKWPIYFFVAVGFRNLIGAGFFGFFLSTRRLLYSRLLSIYMQGLNTTPVHGHTALFGVYGMLGMGLMSRGLRCPPGVENSMLSFAFWASNSGLAGKGVAQPVARWLATDVGERGVRPLGCPLSRVPPDRPGEHPALAAGHRRYDFRRRCSGMVRAWPRDRVVADWRTQTCAAAAIPTCPPA